MKLLRNPEVFKILIIYIGISLVATVAAFLWNPLFGLFTLILCAIMIALHLTSTDLRYKRIARLSADLDMILHGDERLNLAEYSEGELGILQSELYKVILRLRESEQQLKNDKRYLADSLADISHQIRTPLTSINLLLSFLAESDISDERRLEVTRELYELLARIESLVTTLLKISKLDAGMVSFKQEYISLQELIESACAPILIQMELREQVCAIQADGAFCGDLAWTAEALGNIIKNCMEHTPRGGRIEITASETPLFSEILISDTGCGIDADDLPHIFERFYKGKHADDKSFGIGLALARMIVVGQNGTVKAENKPVGGALFTVRFYKGTV